jgi:creatinine amidohydrolase
LETRMFKLTWPEVQEYLKKNDMVLFPVGSTEQHGKHIAEDNDAFTAYEIARRVAEKTGVLVAPPMPFGNSVHHMRFPGSVTLTFQTLVNVYKEVCKSLLHHGFEKIVIMNGHGGNTGAISQALREVKEETGKTVYALMVFPGERGFGSESVEIIEQEGGGHACELETSIALHLDQRVLMEKAEKWRPPASQTEFDRKYRGKIATARDFHERTEIGSLGDPTLATEEKGRKMVEAVVDDIAAFINDLKAKAS